MNIARYRELIEKATAEFISSQPNSIPELYEPISYTLNLGGKRLRPILTLLSCDLFDGNIEEAVHPALGLEVFHNFTLLHDDIMDNAPLRRNQPTVHAKWNNNIAILSGDTMFVRSCQLMAKCPENVMKSVLDCFWDTAIKVCEGQQLDMNFENKDSVTIRQYLHMIELKTAVLLACSLKTGAIIAGARDEDAETIYQFGRLTGVAFQLQDDILDVFGHSEKFGKRVGGDIVSNKKTFLLLKALEIANSYQKEELYNWLQTGEEYASEKVEAVTAIYHQLNIRELAEKEMKRLFDMGINQLEKLPCHPDKIDALRKFALSLIEREN
jgi:geranylgeranyl diphosphate synthase, type II